MIDLRPPCAGNHPGQLRLPVPAPESSPAFPGSTLRDQKRKFKVGSPLAIILGQNQSGAAPCWIMRLVCIGLECDQSLHLLLQNSF